MNGLTDNARKILTRRYLRDGETPEDLFHRVATHIASAEENPAKWVGIFEKMMTDLRFLPNSPMLVNAGRGDQGCLSACFVVSPDDSMDSIMQVAHDAAMIEKWGGGIGFGLSDLRPKGASIATTHGAACGPVAVMKLYSAVGETLTQGSFRLGAHMGQLDIRHPDIEEFIHCKDGDDTLENFNISVQVSDEFMGAVKSDLPWELRDPRDGKAVKTVSAKDLWREICESAWKTGDPGIVFMDRVHETAPNQQLGKIRSSNPCVTGDTLVYTTEGLIRIDKLVGKNPRLTLDSRHGSDVSFATKVWKSGVKPVFKLITEEGYSLKLTLDHGVFTERGKVAALDLKPGDKIRLLNHKGSFGPLPLPMPEGFSPEISHYAVPDFIYRGSEEMQREYLQAIFKNADLSIDTAGFLNKPRRVFLAITPPWLIEGVQQLLLNFGIVSKLEFSKYPSLVFVKDNIRRLYDEFNFLNEAEHTHLARQEVELVFSDESMDEEYVEDNYTATFDRLEHVGEEPVYDLTEPITHSFVANGFSVSNCGEEFIEDYNNCCLGSINLDKHIISGDSGWDFRALAKTVRDGVRFLDNAIEVNQFPLPKLREMNLATRRIGLGVMGWADALARLGVRYDSEQALAMAEEVGDFIRKTAWSESIRLACKRGPFPEYKNSSLKTKSMLGRSSAVRNSSVFTIAPTGTISRIAGCSSGIEPHYALAWHSNLLWSGVGAGLKVVDAPRPLREALDEDEAALERLIREPESSGDILRAHGIDPEIYRSAMEIEPSWHVRMQAAWQKFATNGVSKTINMANGATVEDVSDAYNLAWDLGCKSVSLYRDGSKSRQVLDAKGGEPEEEAREERAARSPRSRPKVLYGSTARFLTHSGNMYVTVNLGPDGKPFEVFSVIGKSGSREAAHMEGLSRMVTLALRCGVSPSEIVDQLKNIESQPVWDEGYLVKSPEDAVARALERHLEPPPFKAAAQENPKERPRQRCRDCDGEMIAQNGCMECKDCGFTVCD